MAPKKAKGKKGGGGQTFPDTPLGDCQRNEDEGRKAVLQDERQRHRDMQRRSELELDVSEKQKENEQLLAAKAEVEAAVSARVVMECGKVEQQMLARIEEQKQRTAKMREQWGVELKKRKRYQKTADRLLERLLMAQVYYPWRLLIGGSRPAGLPSPTPKSSQWQRQAAARDSWRRGDPGSGLPSPSGRDPSRLDPSSAGPSSPPAHAARRQSARSLAAEATLPPTDGSGREQRPGALTPELSVGFEPTVHTPSPAFASTVHAASPIPSPRGKPQPGDPPTNPDGSPALGFRVSADCKFVVGPDGNEVRGPDGRPAVVGPDGACRTADGRPALLVLDADGSALALPLHREGRTLRDGRRLYDDGTCRPRTGSGARVVVDEAELPLQTHDGRWLVEYAPGKFLAEDGCSVPLNPVGQPHVWTDGKAAVITADGLGVLHPGGGKVLGPGGKPLERGANGSLNFAAGDEAALCGVGAAVSSGWHDGVAPDGSTVVGPGGVLVPDSRCRPLLTSSPAAAAPLAGAPDARAGVAPDGVTVLGPSGAVVMAPDGRPVQSVGGGVVTAAGLAAVVVPAAEPAGVTALTDAGAALRDGRRLFFDGSGRLRTESGERLLTGEDGRPLSATDGRLALDPADGGPAVLEDGTPVLHHHNGRPLIWSDGSVAHTTGDGLTAVSAAGELIHDEAGRIVVVGDAGEPRGVDRQRVYVDPFSSASPATDPAVQSSSGPYLLGPSRRVLVDASGRPLRLPGTAPDQTSHGVARDAAGTERALAADGVTVLGLDGEVLWGPDGLPLEAVDGAAATRSGRPVLFRGGAVWAESCTGRLSSGEKLWTDEDGDLRHSDGRRAVRDAADSLLRSADGRLVLEASDRSFQYEDGSVVPLNQYGWPLVWPAGFAAAAAGGVLVGPRGGTLPASDGGDIGVGESGVPRNAAGQPLSVCPGPLEGQHACPNTGAGCTVAPDGRTMLGPDGLVLVQRNGRPVTTAETLGAVVGSAVRDATGAVVPGYCVAKDGTSVVGPDGSVLFAAGGRQASVDSDGCIVTAAGRRCLLTEGPPPLALPMVGTLASGKQVFADNGRRRTASGAVVLAGLRAADGRLVLAPRTGGRLVMEDGAVCPVQPSGKPIVWADGAVAVPCRSNPLLLVGPDGAPVDGLVLDGASGRVRRKETGETVAVEQTATGGAIAVSAGTVAALPGSAPSAVRTTPGSAVRTGPTAAVCAAVTHAGPASRLAPPPNHISQPLVSQPLSGDCGRLWGRCAVQPGAGPHPKPEQDRYASPMEALAHADRTAEWRGARLLRNVASQSPGTIGGVSFALLLPASRSSAPLQRSIGLQAPPDLAVSQSPHRSRRVSPARVNAHSVSPRWVESQVLARRVDSRRVSPPRGCVRRH